MDKARDVAKKKGSKASGSSSMNDDALAWLMVTEMTNQKKEQREAFLEIKRRDVECREREISTPRRHKVLSPVIRSLDHRAADGNI
ncbi:hypothetical protein Tco_1029593 [Tanacetum coccineum]|uniref:No apical meristem-associated C-terminal domain-containing protein n=1 Tax=Tanacetum coccineum TaxID=301880 RepID=A0ABQ5G3V8_9ASTR